MGREMHKPVRLVAEGRSSSAAAALASEAEAPLRAYRRLHGQSAAAATATAVAGRAAYRQRHAKLPHGGPPWVVVSEVKSNQWRSIAASVFIRKLKPSSIDRKLLG